MTTAPADSCCNIITRAPPQLNRQRRPNDVPVQRVVHLITRPLTSRVGNRTHHWALVVGEYYYELIRVNVAPPRGPTTGGKYIDFRQERRSALSKNWTWHNYGTTNRWEEDILVFARRAINDMDPEYHLLNNNCQHFVQKLSAYIQGNMPTARPPIRGRIAVDEGVIPDAGASLDVEGGVAPAAVETFDGPADSQLTPEQEEAAILTCKEFMNTIMSEVDDIVTNDERGNSLVPIAAAEAAAITQTEEMVAIA
ncbi:hypothetical protein CPC08DRAFT_792257 [Agrocybe pediades]|nr:hypothetical protein CPC08DRAFT_792257 [Agrocybe pediades]